MSQDDFPKLGCVNHDCDKCQKTRERQHGLYISIDELEHENNLLRARNERLQRAIDAIVARLEQACGANAMPPVMIKNFIQEMQ